MSESLQKVLETIVEEPADAVPLAQDHVLPLALAQDQEQGLLDGLVGEIQAYLQELKSAADTRGKYETAASEAEKRFEIIGKSESPEKNNVAAEAVAAYMDAEQRARTHAVAANALVKSYELARIAALEQVSASLSAAESHRQKAEHFKKLDEKQPPRKITVVPEEEPRGFFAHLFCSYCN